MKRLLLVVLAFCLCFSVAVAETTVSSRTLELPVENGFPNLDVYAERIVIEDKDRQVSWVTDLDLNKISDEYARIVGSYNGHYRVYTGSGMTTCGLIDLQGNIVIPTEYADTKALSDRWAVGFILADGTKDDYDYSTYGLYVNSSNKKYYVIDTADLYFKGQKVGSFTRQEWSQANPYGDYIFILDRNGKWAWYDKNLVKSPVREISEFGYNNELKQVIHSASGQPAFTPECTLTEDEVRQTLWIDFDKKLLDLKGNELADFSAYYYAWFIDIDSDLIRIETEDGKYGLADRTGKEILPCIYDGLYTNDDSEEKGYIRAEKDGKDVMISLATGKEVSADREAFSGSYSTCFVKYEDRSSGEITVLSALAGVLPEHYKEVYEYGRYALVTKMDDTKHLIGLLGEDLLPDANLSDLYTINEFAGLVQLNVYDQETGKYNYILYTIAYDPDLDN